MSLFLHFQQIPSEMSASAAATVAAKVIGPITYYIGFTPSCNKDSYTSSVLGAYTTKEEAEMWLAKWLSGAIEDMGPLDTFKVETYDNERYVVGTDDLVYPYIQQYVFDEHLDVEDYQTILGHEMDCLGCTSYTPSFWIIGADSKTPPGAIRQDLESLIV